MDKVQDKKGLVQELINLHKDLNVQGLYTELDHKTTKDWFANVSAVLKYLSENDYKFFQSLQDDLYLDGVDVHFRECIAQKIDRFIRQKIAEYKKNDFSELAEHTNYWNYTNPFWLLLKLLSFLWKYKIISGLIIIVTLLASDYSLAWKNTIYIIKFIQGLFK